MVRKFGVTPAGEEVQAVTLHSEFLSCEVLTYGAVLRSLVVPDRMGHPVDVVLGYDTLEEYENSNGFLGAVPGRCANRIGGARFTLDGVEYPLFANNGPNHLHGGKVSFGQRVWTLEEAGEDYATMTLLSPDGQEGYPGTLRAWVTYRLEDAALVIHYRAETDKATLCNLTNHAYFNLAGHGAGSVLDQQLQLFASRYTPTDAGSIPTGEIAPVEGTPMDFTRATPIGERIDQPFVQLQQAGGYDHNYVLDGQEGFRPVARAVCARTGIVLSCETTLPGVQLYSANHLSGRRGKDGARYAPRSGFCLETQFYPDAIHHPEFPSPVLRPGETWDHTTRFHFSVK